MSCLCPLKVSFSVHQASVEPHAVEKSRAAFSFQSDPACLHLRLFTFAQKTGPQRKAGSEVQEACALRCAVPPYFLPPGHIGTLPVSSCPACLWYCTYPSLAYLVGRHLLLPRLYVRAFLFPRAVWCYNFALSSCRIPSLLPSSAAQLARDLSQAARPSSHATPSPTSLLPPEAFTAALAACPFSIGRSCDH